MNKKLQLNRETLLPLTPDHLRVVDGGTGSIIMVGTVCETKGTVTPCSRSCNINISLSILGGGSIYQAGSR